MICKSALAKVYGTALQAEKAAPWVNGVPSKCNFKIDHLSARGPCSMKLSTERILTTHVGSLPRSHALLDLLRPKLVGEQVDQAALDARITLAVDDIVREQVAAGLDVINDGEQSKSGFANYVRDRARLALRPRPSETHAAFAGENSWRSRPFPSTTPATSRRCSPTVSRRRRAWCASDP